MTSLLLVVLLLLYFYHLIIHLYDFSIHRTGESSRSYRIELSKRDLFSPRRVEFLDQGCKLRSPFLLLKVKRKHTVLLSQLLFSNVQAYFDSSDSLDIMVLFHFH